MNIKKLVCVLSAVALASAASAQTQSLTELAKQEKQRRAKARTGTPSKVYTESDRPTTAAEPVADGMPTTTVTTAADGTVPVKKGTKEKTPEELAAEKQADWNARVKKAQDEITSLQGVISRNERTLNSTYNVTPARADLANQIEADKKKLAELQQQLVNLEEERRRAGMPRTR